MLTFSSKKAVMHRIIPLGSMHVVNDIDTYYNASFIHVARTRFVYVADVLVMIRILRILQQHLSRPK